MRILALDLATKTGWALWDGSRIESGVQDFTKRRGESNGMLFINFNTWLHKMVLGVELIVYEQPAIFRSGAANEIATGLCTRVQEIGERYKKDYVPVPVPTLKKWATGSGRAEKDAMKVAANRLLRDQHRMDVIEDDNEADAICLLFHAIEKYEGGSCSVPTVAAVSTE